MRANTILGSWATIPDLIHESKLMALFDPEAQKAQHAESAAHAREATESAAKAARSDSSGDEHDDLCSGEQSEVSNKDNN